MSKWLKACGESGTCVEVLKLKTIVKIRDSKNPAGPELKFTHEEWEQFTAGVVRGVFD